MNRLWVFIPVLLMIVFPQNAAYAEEWEPIGPYGGCIIGVVSDSTDPDQAVAISCYPSSSYVYRTQDGGQNWNKISPFPDSSWLEDMSAFDTSRIYVLCTEGCYYTQDGGVSWDYSAFPVGSGWPQAICADPVNPYKVHAAGYKSKYLIYFLSVDGGQSWTTYNLGYGQHKPRCIDVCETNPDIIYISGYIDYNNEASMFRSLDGGVTWDNLSSAVDTTKHSSLNSVAVDPTNSNNVYAAGVAFYKSADGGNTWSKDTSHEFLGEAIGIDPIDGVHLYVAGEQMFVSADYGQTWIMHPCLNGRGSHVEVSQADPSVIYTSAKYTAYAQNYNGGLYKSTDWGATWSPFQTGITGHTVPSIAVAPSQTETVYIDVWEDNCLKVTYDSGETLHDLTYPSDSDNSIWEMMVDSSDVDTVFALSEGLHRSTDGGSVWSKDLEEDSLRCLKEDPSDPEIVYAGGDEGTGPGGTEYLVLYKSTDGGTTWPTKMIIDSGIELDNYSFDVAGSDPSVFYYLAMQYYSVKVFRTADSGVTWVDVTGNLDTLLEKFDFVYTLWIAPDDEDFVLVGTEVGVFYTTTAGQVWGPTSLTVSVWDLCYNPVMDTLYAATEHDGVYHSKDRGITWQEMNNGLDELETRCIDVDPQNGILFLGTWGSSAWRLAIEMPLKADRQELPETTGDTVELSFNAGFENAGDQYFLMCGLMGTSPGTTLPGGLVCPCNWDPLVMPLVRSLNNISIFFDFTGTLDGNGMAFPRFEWPGYPGSAGLNISFAGCTIYPFDFVTNPVEIKVVP